MTHGAIPSCSDRATAAPLAADVRSIAVLMPTWVGDVVMATPVLRALRRHRPGARVLACLRPGLEHLLAGLECVDAIEVIPKSGLRGPMRIARALKAHGPDVVVVLPGSFRSALAALFAGVPVRIGYEQEMRGRLLTHRLERTASKPPHIESTIDTYIRLAEWMLGVPIDDRRPMVTCTADDRAIALELLRDVSRPFAVLCPGASKDAKRWPADRFAAVADALAQQHGMASVVIGGPGEEGVIESVCAAAKRPIVDLQARGLTLGALKGLLAEARLMVTNDTGPRHIAAALNVPAITLYGPTDLRWTRLPHEAGCALVAEPFLPDDLLADDHPQACRIEKISVADVSAALTTLLREPRSARP